MSQQQQKDILDKRDSFNILRVLVAAHATTIAIFIRQGFGSEALGFRGLFAALLLLATFTFTHNPLFWHYLLVWLAALVCQRIYTGATILRGVRLHSKYDGVPVVAMLFTKKESTAKLVIEPALCFLASIGLGVAADAYQDSSLAGLAAWLFCGCFSLGLDHGIHEALQHRRLQALRDSRLEQEELMRRYQEEGW